jgi:Ni,Fe-hydrogenase III large subunit
VKTLFNGVAVPRQELPLVSVDELRGHAAEARQRGRRAAAFFAVPLAEALELVLVLADDAAGSLEVGRARLSGDSFPSFTPVCPELHLFEREIAEQWGVRPEGHPWLKPVRFQAPRRGKDVWGRPAGVHPQSGVMEFYRVEGEEVHEVAVGPVHAGVIEPGHFRFQCHGEQVFHLEISLGYQHRGVEAALIGGPDKRSIHYAETLAGDTTIGHATAYCQSLEALSGDRPPARGQALRAIALELERLANHAGDLGALTANFNGRLRGDFLNITALLCGSRFGRGLVRPGGAGFDAEPGRVGDALERLEKAFGDVQEAVDLLWSTPSVGARFEETGRVGADVALQLGMVGLAARASGLERDVRKTHPWGMYRFAHIPVSTSSSGDVYARAYVRWLEMQRSHVFVRQQLRELPRGAARAACKTLRPEMFCISLVEGWRGEICHVAMTDAQGRFALYKVVDPSFHNWSGLAMALRDQQISDFPLCNKSFNLSYAGHDL